MTLSTMSEHCYADCHLCCYIGQSFGDLSHDGGSSKVSTKNFANASCSPLRIVYIGEDLFRCYLPEICANLVSLGDEEASRADVL